MSGYEDPEGTGDWRASGRSRRGRGRSDPREPSARSDQDFDPFAQPSRTRRVLGRHPVVSVLAILVTLTITFVAVAAYAAFRSVYDSIHHVVVTSGELGKRPPKLNGSENILIIGLIRGRLDHALAGGRLILGPAVGGLVAVRPESEAKSQAHVPYSRTRR